MFEDYKLYVPEEISSTKCVILQDHNTLRVYDTIPEENSSSTYTDYFFNSHYLRKDGSYTFSSDLPVCLSSEILTNDFFYRTDIDSILLIFLVLFLFIFGIPWKMFTKFLKRWS